MSIRSETPAPAAAIDAPPAPQGGLAPDDVYRWALDPLQSFGSLLTIAASLSETLSKPSDVATGTPALNLYLTVCALDQVLSDYLHRHFYDFSRRYAPPVLRRALRGTSRLQQSAQRALVGVTKRDLIRRQARFAELARSLGRAILDGRAVPAHADSDAILELSRLSYPRSLLVNVLKVPQSFRGVDLYPEDCELIARRAIEAMGQDGAPVAVIGLRTSGMYMAGLTAAAFDRAGRPGVELISLRPGVPALAHETLQLRRIARAGGWAFVVDDPPWYGSAFERAIAVLNACGFDDRRIQMAVCEIGNQPVFAGGEAQPNIWTGFRTTQKVVLEKSEWSIHRRLSNESAERFLNRDDVLARLGAVGVKVLRGDDFTDRGEPPPTAAVNVRRRERRFHVQKLFEIEVTLRDGTRTTELVLGRGVGLGFFGYHSYLTALSVEPFIPHLLGFENGVLFRLWEKGWPVTRETIGGSDIETIGSYITRRAMETRHEAGPIAAPPEVRSAFTGSRLVARTLSRSMGRVGPMAQFRVADTLTRELAPPIRTALDARMGLDEWVRNDGGAMVKIDFEEHGADITDRRVSDPLHDLAAAVVGLQLEPAEEARLVDRYSAETGDRDRIRSRMAYQKLMAAAMDMEAILAPFHLAGSSPDRDLIAGNVNRTSRQLTRAVNGYLATLYRAGRPNRETGDVWAIDLDDTLETEWLGFSATSPAGARALRALAEHDQLVVVSSGRSLGEVQDRCELFGLAGGIAEYGAVAWDARHGRVLSLVGDDDLHGLERVRQAVIEETDFTADPRYAHTLRLFRQTAAGRRGVSAQDVKPILDRLGLDGLRVVEGYSKTVVWAAGTDKARALSPLLESLEVERRARRLHAIGDSITDLGMMALADRRHAPANAGDPVKSRARDLAISVARRGWGAGVLEIVDGELHGSIRRCPACGSVETDRGDDALITLLGLQDRSRWARFAYAIHPSSLRAFEL